MEKRTLWHKIDPTENSEGKDWHTVTLIAVDANHALEVDPDHWSSEKPVDPVDPVEPEEVVEAETSEEDEQ